MKDQLYTIVVETPDGSTMVEQVTATDQANALTKVNMALPKKILADFIKDGCVPLDLMRNVWCSVASKGKGIYLMHVILTSNVA